MVSTCLQRRTHWTFGLQIAQCPWRCTLDLCTWLHCTLHSLRQTDFFVSNVEETSNTWWANGRRSFAISSHLFTSSLFDETFWNSDFDPSRRTINQKIQQQSKKEYQQSLQFSQQQPSVHLMTSLMCLIWLREHWCTLKHLGGFQTAGVLSDKTTWDPGTKTKGSASSATPIRKAFLSSIYSLSLYSPPTSQNLDTGISSGDSSSLQRPLVGRLLNLKDINLDDNFRLLKNSMDTTPKIPELQLTQGFSCPIRVFSGGCSFEGATQSATHCIQNCPCQGILGWEAIGRPLALFTKGLTYCDEQTHSNRLSRGLPSRSLEGASENPVDASLDEFQLLRLAVDTVKLKHKASSIRKPAQESFFPPQPLVFNPLKKASAAYWKGPGQDK